jgi:hypothetical protein
VQIFSQESKSPDLRVVGTWRSGDVPRHPTMTMFARYCTLLSTQFWPMHSWQVPWKVRGLFLPLTPQILVQYGVPSIIMFSIIMSQSSPAPLEILPPRSKPHTATTNTRKGTRSTCRWLAPLPESVSLLVSERQGPPNPPRKRAHRRAKKSTGMMNEPFFSLSPPQVGLCPITNIHQSCGDLPRSLLQVLRLPTSQICRVFSPSLAGLCSSWSYIPLIPFTCVRV